MKALLFELKIFITLIFLAIFITLIDTLGLLNLVKTLLQSITIPIQYGVYSTTNSFEKQIAFLTSARMAAKENSALKQQLALVLAENSELKTKIKRFDEYDTQIKDSLSSTFDLVPAKVITSGKYLSIDKGSNDDIKEGQVVVFKGTLLGIIKSTTPKVSLVIPPTDPEFKISVFSQNTEGTAKGILQGQFGSELLMDKILHQENIEVDDLVYSEGIEGEIPKGLIVGKVVKVEENPNQIFKTALIEPLFDSSDLDLVFILKIQ